MIVFDSDDFGCSHVISDMCQSHDCRDKLDEFHYANNNFKATLFAIPGEMTAELALWCKANSSWIELAVHGFYHETNYECEKMAYAEFDTRMNFFKPMLDEFFVKGFKAPGWQISDDIYQWLVDHGWWVADQSYNNKRRPFSLSAYVNDNGNFMIYQGAEPGYDKNIVKVNGKHFHTWDCVGNGVYELSDQIKQDIQGETEFQFVSEAIKNV